MRAMSAAHRVNRSLRSAGLRFACISLRSWPAQKAFPAPDRITTLIVSFSAIVSSSACKVASIALLSAFKLLGDVIVRCAMWSLSVRVSRVMGLPLSLDFVKA